MLSIFVDDWPVPRELEFGRHGGPPLHGNRLADDRHRLPCACISVARGIGRVGLVDVQILLVDREDREAPRPVLVVPDRYARQRGLTRPDHIPARGDKVNPVAEGWQLDRPMRVVGHDRGPREGTLRRDHPVVAPLGCRILSIGFRRCVSPSLTAR